MGYGNPLIDPLLLDLPTRLITALDRNELRSLDAILSLSRSELEDLDGVGSVLLDALMEHLESFDRSPGDSLPEAPLYPESLEELIGELSGLKRRWWTGKGVKMYRRFTPISGDIDGENTQCTVDTGARKMTIRFDPAGSRVDCPCRKTTCNTHGLAAALFLARDARLRTLFNRSLFDGDQRARAVPMDPLFFLLHGNTRNKLVRDGVNWTEELAALTPDEMNDISGIGPKRVEQITEYLNALGLKAGEPPESLELEPENRIDQTLGTYVFHLREKTLEPERGIELFRNDAVQSLQQNDDGTYRATVHGYETVQVTVSPEQGTCDCSCSLSPYTAPCEHAFATALAAARRNRVRVLSVGSEEDIGEDLTWLMDQIKTESSTKTGNIEAESCWYYLYKPEQHWRLYVSASRVSSIPDHLYRGEQLNASPVSPSAVQNPKDASLLRRLNDRYFSSRRPVERKTTFLGELLPLLSDRNVRIEDPAGTFQDADIMDEEAQPLLRVTPARADGFQIRTNLNIGNRTVSGTQLELFSSDPVWIRDEHRLYRTANEEVVSKLIERETESPLTFSKEELSTFSERIFPEMQKRELMVELEHDMLEEAHVEPEGRVYLRDGPERLIVELRLAYGDMEFTDITEGRFPITDPETGELLAVRRNTERETQLLETLRRTGLRSISNADPLRLEPVHGRADWLLDELPELPDRGFDVHGERMNRRTPDAVEPSRSEVRVSSGIDWFELQGEIDFDGTSVPCSRILSAVEEGRSYVQLSENEYGKIPEHWISWFSRVDELAELDDDGLRLPEHSAGELHRLLQQADETRTDQTVRKYRRFYREFDGIEERAEPAGFDGTLRDYQRAGLAWLQFLRTYEFGGLLADDMGLGKTIQVLAHLQLVAEEQGTFPDTLVVAPRSVLKNWEREAKRFLPDPNLYQHHGTGRLKTPDEWPEQHLGLTTYGTMRRDAGWLKERTFDTIVLDESQAIRNPDTQTAKASRLLDANHRIALSGTPVQNTVMDLWSQFQFLNPGLLGSRSFFADRYVKSIDKHHEQTKSRHLREMIHPFILRRTKSQVESQLPPLSRSTIECPMDPDQTELYESIREHYRSEISDMIREDGVNQSRFKVLEGLMRLRQICCHPSLIQEGTDTGSTKMDRFSEMASEVIREGHRVLVFSQFVSFLERLQTEVERHGWRYEYLDGSTQNREERVRRFQEDDSISFFLISLRAGGEGLNLTGADYVFLMDPWWNPAVEQQAMDRTHRIGQNRPVFVYRFICPDTIEEKILSLQERKETIADNLITPDADVFKSMEKEDLLSLFS